MNREDKKKVQSFIVKYGDGFWGEGNNEYLFEDIIQAVNKAGYDLHLTKKDDNKPEKNIKAGHNMYTSTVNLKTPGK